MTDDNKYKNGKIYTIRYRNDDSLIYVGSTTQPLYKRWHQHKLDSIKQQREKIKLYQKFNETDINNWYIELYEDCPCERKEELNKREGEVIRNIGTLNKRIAGRSNKEYREDNKDMLAEKDKKYREANKDIISKKYKEYEKKYRESNKDKAKEKITCDCGCIVNKMQITRHQKTQKHQQIIKTISI